VAADEAQASRGIFLRCLQRVTLPSDSGMIGMRVWASFPCWCALAPLESDCACWIRTSSGRSCLVREPPWAVQNTGALSSAPFLYGSSGEFVGSWCAKLVKQTGEDGFLFSVQPLFSWFWRGRLRRVGSGVSTIPKCEKHHRCELGVSRNRLVAHMPRGVKPWKKSLNREEEPVLLLGSGSWHSETTPRYREKRHRYFRGCTA